MAFSYHEILSIFFQWIIRKDQPPTHKNLEDHYILSLAFWNSLIIVVTFFGLWSV